MTATFNKRPLKSIINTEALDYALYTIEGRAIAHLIDGLKPVQRFFLYSTYANARNSFNKVAAVSGRVSEYGYEHGETSAADAGQLMASTWANNYPIIQGRGNFGSRMVQDMAAARYTYCKIHDNFNVLFKDTDIAPKHKEASHLPPAYYLPVIPYILINGVQGVATGFATNIFPHDIDDVVRCVKEYIETGDIVVEPKIKFPEFNGHLTPRIEEGKLKLNLYGKYNLVGQTKLVIDEIPYKYDRIKYVELLDKLEEKGIIVRYSDLCGKENFKFEIILKRDFLTDDIQENDNKILTTFKLTQSLTQNLTAIDWNRKLCVFERSSELIKVFVDHRKEFVQKRIDNNIVLCENKLNFANAKIEFINKVIADEIVLKGITRAKALREIKEHDNLSEFAEQLISMNMYHMTNDEVAKLKKQASELKRELNYWKKVTVVEEYLKDLEEL